jgi:transposase
MKAKQRFDLDPLLEKISLHIPDEKINFLFPFRKFNTQGSTRKFKTNQLYRAHLLAMLKGVTSFNKICAELKTRRLFRDFCRFKNKQILPVKRVLSEFRDFLRPSGFEKITHLITANLLQVVSMPKIKVAIPDTTDIPANCKGFSKKNVHALLPALVGKSTPPLGLPRESERKKRADSLLCGI